jgi:hypothetical protein
MAKRELISSPSHRTPGEGGITQGTVDSRVGSHAWILTFIAALGLIPGLASLHASIQPEASGSEVTVFVSRRCPMAKMTWKTAEKTATQLFGRIGVRLRFTTVMPEETDKRSINLLIVDRAPKDLRPHVLGAATSDPTFGPVIFVFYDRLLEFHEYAYPEDAGIVLGYAIAHEIGHVLRSEPGHSEAGVMKAYWNPKDAAAMLRNSVMFTIADSERIHQVLADRSLANKDLTLQN